VVIILELFSKLVLCGIIDFILCLVEFDRAYRYQISILFSTRGLIFIYDGDDTHAAQNSNDDAGGNCGVGAFASGCDVYCGA